MLSINSIRTVFIYRSVYPKLLCDEYTRLYDTLWTLQVMQNRKANSYSSYIRQKLGDYEKKMLTINERCYLSLKTDLNAEI